MVQPFLFFKMTALTTPPTYLELETHLRTQTNPGITPVIIFHHSDMDGAMAAASAALAFMSEPLSALVGCNDSLDTVQFVEVNYGRYTEESVLSSIPEKDAVVFVLDFAFDRELSDKIAEKAAFFRILDHHATSEAALTGAPYAYFDMMASGARMTFEYFNPGAVIPLAVTLADNRDLWKKDTGYEDAFHESMMYLKNNHYKGEHKRFILSLIALIEDTASTAESLCDGPCNSAIEVGEYMLQKRDANINYIIDESNLLFGQLGGVPAVFVNYGVDQSDVCEALYRQERYKKYIVAAYSVKGGKMNFSLRKNAELNVDLSKIAEEHYGGGGHKVAAGFNVSIERGTNIILNKEKWALCWNAAAVDYVLDQGDTTVSVIEELKKLKPFIRSRATCEKDKSVLQILPYIVVHDDKTNKTFTYRRPVSSGERRLYGNTSIGLGGHIDTVPPEGVSLAEHIGAEAARELFEEVGISPTTLNVAETVAAMFDVGNFDIIRNTDREVEAVHLALVFHLRVPDASYLTEINYEEIQNPLWRSMEELITDVRLDRLPMENWTKTVIANVSQVS